MKRKEVTNIEVKSTNKRKKLADTQVRNPANMAVKTITKKKALEPREVSTKFDIGQHCYAYGDDNWKFGIIQQILDSKGSIFYEVNISAIL